MLPQWSWLFILPIAGAPLVYFAGRLFARRTYEPRHNLPAQVAALMALLAASWFWVQSFAQYQAQGPLEWAYNGVTFRFDGISLLLSAAVLGLTLLAVLFSGAYLARDEGQEKFFALVCIMAGAMIGLACAADLFNLWVWFETMAVASYMLVAFHRDEPGALEAGVKYLVQSAAGSVLVLMGIALVLGQTGTLSFAGIRAAAGGALASGAGAAPAAQLPLLAAGALFLVGFGVKAALVPLHTWLPDAHSQAPSGISALLSGVVIETGLVALLRALGLLVNTTAAWGGLLLAFGAVNMLLGNLLALRQAQVKRLLAFSSLSHMGYILVGMGAAVAFGQVNGAAGGFFHLLNHAAMKGLAFLAAGSLLYALHIARHEHSPLLVTDLAGASRRYPLVAFALSVALLALGGLPPLSGFMSKWQIFLAGFETRSAWVIAVVIFAALNSVLSLGYYAPLVNLMYRREPSEAVQAGAPIPTGMLVPLVVLVALVVLLGFAPGLLNGLTLPAGSDLLASFGW